MNDKHASVSTSTITAHLLKGPGGSLETGYNTVTDMKNRRMHKILDFIFGDSNP